MTPFLSQTLEIFFLENMSKIFKNADPMFLGKPWKVNSSGMLFVKYKTPKKTTSRFFGKVLGIKFSSTHIKDQNTFALTVPGRTLLLDEADFYLGQRAENYIPFEKATYDSLVAKFVRNGLWFKKLLGTIVPGDDDDIDYPSEMSSISGTPGKPGRPEAAAGANTSSSSSSSSAAPWEGVPESLDVDAPLFPAASSARTRPIPSGKGEALDVAELTLPPDDDDDDDENSDSEREQEPDESTEFAASLTEQPTGVGKLIFVFLKLCSLIVLTIPGITGEYSNIIP